MSDSDDLELGGFAPTTPMVPARKGRPPKKTNGRTEPGPSNAKSKSNGRKRANPPSDSEIEMVEREVTREPSETSQATRKPALSRVEPMPGKQPAKGKGKTKAPAPKAARQDSPAEKAGTESPIEILEDELAGSENVGPWVARALAQQSTKRDETKRLREQLRRAESQIEALSRQLEEVFRVRETEPEKLLKEQAIRYEAQFNAQQQIIQELNAQLRKKDPLMRSGNNNVLNLLTREAADEEKKKVEEDVARWKNLANERQKAIDMQEAKIKELQQNEKDLQVQLKAEIERANTYAAKSSKVSGSVLRNARSGGMEDPKHTEIIRFYEDVTNLIIPNIKPSKSQRFDLDEWVLSCVYTWSNTGEEAAATLVKSIHFSLRSCWDDPPSGPAKSKDELVEAMNYVPQNLDKEDPDFVAKLGFLGSPFTFGRSQLALFFRTMHSTIGEALSDDEEATEDTS